MEDKLKPKKKRVIKKPKIKVFENNSAFKRAMVQMGVKQGDIVKVSFEDGTLYEVKCL